MVTWTTVPAGYEWTDQTCDIDYPASREATIKNTGKELADFLWEDNLLTPIDYITSLTHIDDKKLKEKWKEEYNSTEDWYKESTLISSISEYLVSLKYDCDKGS